MLTLELNQLTHSPPFSFPAPYGPQHPKFKHSIPFFFCFPFPVPTTHSPQHVRSRSHASQSQMNSLNERSLSTTTTTSNHQGEQSQYQENVLSVHDQQDISLVKTPPTKKSPSAPPNQKHQFTQAKQRRLHFR